jgi:3-oxoacyl-[acyl-carrier-protein] synthase II
MITSLGQGREATWSRLVRGDRGIGPVALFDVQAQRSRIAAQAAGVTLPESGSARAAWSRTSAMAMAAAREAISAAKLDVRGKRVGLVVGATTGGMFETEALLAELHAKPSARDALVAMLSHPLTSTGDLLEEALGPFTRVRTLCSACSSGANALVVAASWLLAGEVDAVVAGGSDGLCRLTFTGFNALGAVDPEPCRPFDRSRRGLTLGEGAGFVVLERSSAAKARSATPIVELAGWALGAEAHHITNPESDGAVVAALLGRAIARSKVDLADVGYVNAHGTGTTLNDPIEARALTRALGARIAEVPVSSSKAQIGHTLGAAGAIEAIITAMAIERQMLPPTAGLDEPDPACALVHVPHRGRAAKVRAAISNSFGFGGMDTVLVVTEPELAAPLRSTRRTVVVTGASALTPSGLVDARGAAGLLDAASPASAVVASEDLDARLDIARARRLDRPARLGAVVVEHALADAGVAGSAHGDLDTNARGRTGVVIGSAFGSVDASAAFMHRLFEKGPRLANPAEFPNLVPSSPVGHVSIYLGLRGPVFATADLATSGESAFVQAAELVAVGEADRIVAGSVEEKSGIVERILAALFARARTAVPRVRGEGAAAIVVESREAADARGAAILAELEQSLEWRGTGEGALLALRAPRDASRALVVLARANGGVDAMLAPTPWSACTRATCDGAGEHEGLGAIAIAAALGRLARGEADEVLVIGLARGRGYAIVLASARASREDRTE